MDNAQQGKPDHDIRDYPLMELVHTLYTSMNTEELKAIHAVMAAIAQHLEKKHFHDKIEINVKSLVKTFGELDEIALEILLNQHGIGLTSS
jgi:hypothetical protein